MEDTRILRWLMDVDPLWSGPRADTTRPLTLQWAPSKDVQASLDLLFPGEKAKVLQFRFESDAKMSLASCLLKRRAITEICKVPWSEAIVSQDRNRKPCYQPQDGGGKEIEFNISHHGTVVALAACEGSAVKLGIDVVSINLAKDVAAVSKSGFGSWARTYDSVFSDREIDDIIHFSTSDIVDARASTIAKVRHFYAHWCLKEAYVKMTGEALLAPWLKDLEFRNVKTPKPANELGVGSEWGELVEDVEIWFHGKRVTDVKLEIQAFRSDYMIAVAASSQAVGFSPYQLLELERDIHP